MDVDVYWEYPIGDILGISYWMFTGDILWVS